MAFTVTDLVFVIDVTAEEEHDVANFELHDGVNLLRKQAITCGTTNNKGRYPTYEDKAFAVGLGEPDQFNSLRDALRAMLSELDSAEADILARHAKRMASDAKKERKASRKP